MNLKSRQPLHLFALLVILFSFATTTNIAAAQNVKPMKNAPNSFADLAEDLLPSVVNISSTQKITNTQAYPQFPEFPEGSPFKDFFDEFMGQRMGPVPAIPAASLGSGFVIDGEKGLIVTNGHVVAGADEVRVTFADDTNVHAEVLGTDEKTDIALLQVKTKKKLKGLKFGNSDKMRVGDWVVAIGNPFGLGGTVTAGIISARQRNINAGPYDDFLQTDASINRGNSGGPMFNLNGEVIGINTAIFSPSGGSVGIGFAIPSNLAAPVIKQLIKYGKTRRGWLGVRIQTVTDEIAESLGLDKARGAMVASVTQGGPAAKANMQVGDIILSFNGHDIDSVRELPRVVAETEIGATVPLTFWREKKVNKVEVKVGELEKAEETGLLDMENVPSTRSKVSNSTLGMTFGQDNQTGSSQIIITNIEPQSEAAEKGLMPGDIILEINQQTPKSPQDASTMIEEAKKQGKAYILLLVNAKGGAGTRFVALKLGAGE